MQYPKCEGEKNKEVQVERKWDGVLVHDWL
jgi:hypothetical protein